MKEALCLSAQGLGIGPDVPHAVTAPGVTEGNGVGVLKEPPVGTSASIGEAGIVAKISNIGFISELNKLNVETVLLGRVLLVQVPPDLNVDGIKEQLVCIVKIYFFATFILTFLQMVIKTFGWLFWIDRYFILVNLSTSY